MWGSGIFETLSQEARDLYIPREVPRLPQTPGALEFLRKWVTPNIPVVIKGGALHWPAIDRWNSIYLTDVLKNKKVSVAVTPNGFADSIERNVEINGQSQDVFVLPEERSIRIGDLFAKLEGHGKFTDPDVAESEGIFYLQKQNSNLTDEFPELLCDIDEHLSWATDAFGEPPTAINLWIGDKRSVTSLHKDPFENIYCVVKGWKEFTLIAPTDRPWLPYKTVPVAEYKEVEPGVFTINPKDLDENDPAPADVPWIIIDPINPDLDSYPEFSKCTPLKVRVEAGDLLYLPSLWFHHVQQSDGCIAVNFWFEMAMDIKYAYFQFLELLVKEKDVLFKK